MIYRLASLILLVIFIPADGVVILKSCRYDSKYELEGYPKVGNEFTLKLFCSSVLRIHCSL
jgi:hypothetical protein